VENEGFGKEVATRGCSGGTKRTKVVDGNVVRRNGYGEMRRCVCPVLFFE